MFIAVISAFTAIIAIFGGEIAFSLIGIVGLLSTGMFVIFSKKVIKAIEGNKKLSSNDYTYYIVHRFWFSYL